MTVQPGSVSHLVLLALRPGPMETAALHERFVSANQHLGSMTRSGLIEKWGESSYRITARGLAACPSRRSVALSRRDMRGRRQHVPTATTAEAA